MKTKKSKEDWVIGAFKVLSEKGIHAVKVEKIARDLGVTKGSFYGYFINRDALLQEMLDYWEDTLTERTIARVRKVKGNLQDQLTQLLGHVDNQVDESLDRAMTSWSFKDQRARVIVNRGVRNRLDFIKGLFLNHGFSDTQAELRARIVHGFVHGDRHYPDTCEPKGSNERKAMILAFIDLVCKP